MVVVVVVVFPLGKVRPSLLSSFLFLLSPPSLAFTLRNSCKGLWVVGRWEFCALEKSLLGLLGKEGSTHLHTVSSPSGWVLAAFAGSLQGPELLGLRLCGSSGERRGSSCLPPPVCRALAPVDLRSWDPAALELQQEGCTAHSPAQVERGADW